MRLGRVTGTVVSTVKDDGLKGYKLLLVDEADVRGEGRGRYIVAVDTVDAGVGDVVLTVGGSSARLTRFTRDRPVDAAIVAIIETLEVEGEITYRKAGAS
jgi:microcompartment protein CcmK/EutM